jgi:hypothetical protein
MLLPSSEAEYPASCDRVAKYNAVYSHLDAFAHSSTIGFKMYATPPRESLERPPLFSGETIRRVRKD